MALTKTDPVYWQDDGNGGFLYIHKLAVKREATGNGISHELITYAKKEGIRQGKQAIRLDCNAALQKLRSLYENQGFALVNEVEKSDGYRLTLYSCDLENYVQDLEKS